MQNLKRGSKGSDVVTLQTFLKSKGYYIDIDGDYGPSTAKVVYWYQKNEGLKADSRFGPGSRASMAKAGPCKYQRFNIDKQTSVVRMLKVATTGKVLNPKRMTIKSMLKLLAPKATCVMNGTLYDTKTMADMAKLKVDGKWVGGSYFDKYGLAILEDGSIFVEHAQKDNFHEFMGFSPVLHYGGKDLKHNAGLSKSFLDTKHPRSVVAVGDTYIHAIVVRGRNRARGWYGANMDVLKAYVNRLAQYDGDNTVCSGNFDGGGSTGLIDKFGMLFGSSLRGVANGIAFTVKGI